MLVKLGIISQGLFSEISKKSLKFRHLAGIFTYYHWKSTIHVGSENTRTCTIVTWTPGPGSMELPLVYVLSETTRRSPLRASKAHEVRGKVRVRVCLWRSLTFSRWAPVFSFQVGSLYGLCGLF